MKKITWIIAILCSVQMMAQVPNAFKYQAVARTSAGVVMNEHNISVQISILESGSAIYTEAHALTTNSTGLFTLNIGDGISSLGDFTTIDWSTGIYSVEVALDENAGSNYTLMGTSPLLTVPYAMHAKTAENTFSGDYSDLSNTPDIPSNTSDLANDSGFITNADDADANPVNEIQDLAQVLSEGNQANAQIKLLTDPTEAQDAATKAYVDALENRLLDLEIAMGLKIKDIEGNAYKIVTIGTQTWMAENLRSTMYADGTPIPMIEDNAEWGNLADTNLFMGSACAWAMNDSAGLGQSYGVFYTWAAAMGARDNVSDTATANNSNPGEVQGVCPDGWHLPSRSEFEAMISFIASDGYTDAEGDALKDEETWDTGMDIYGFSQLPSGIRHFSTGGFQNYDAYGKFWTSTQSVAVGGEPYAITSLFSNTNNQVYPAIARKSTGIPVRCVKD